MRRRALVVAVALALFVVPGAMPSHVQAQEPIGTYTGSFEPIPDLPFLANEFKLVRYTNEVRITFRVELTSSSGGQGQCFSFEGNDLVIPATFSGEEATFSKEMTFTSGVADVPCEVGIGFSEAPTTAPITGVVGAREASGTVGGPSNVMTLDFNAVLEGIPEQPTAPTGPDLLSVPATSLKAKDIEAIFRQSRCGVPPSEACNVLIRDVNDRFERVRAGLDGDAGQSVRRAIGLTTLRKPGGTGEGEVLLPTLSKLLPVITKLGVTASSGGADADQARLAMYRLIRLAITMDLGTNL